MKKQFVHLEPFVPLSPETSIIEAIDKMDEMKVSVPVVNAEGAYMGLVSEDSLLELGDDRAPVSKALNVCKCPFCSSRCSLLWYFSGSGKLQINFIARCG